MTNNIFNVFLQLCFCNLQKKRFQITFLTFFRNTYIIIIARKILRNIILYISSKLM